MIPLAIIRAQMATGATQRRQTLQLPQSQQVGPVQPPGARRAGASAEQAEDGRPPADARAHASEEDGGAVGAGKRSRQEARGSREGLLGDEGKKKKYGMCSDPASWQAACAATLAAIQEVTSPEAKKLAEEGGYVIDNPLKLAALLHTAVVKLVQVLPVKRVIHAAGIKENDLVEVDAGRVLGYILRRVQTKWRYSMVNKARRRWMRLELWLRDEGTRHEEGSINAMTLNEYFLHCHRQSVGGSDKEWEAKLERWSTSVDKAATAGTKAPPRPVRRRFGNKGALGQYDALHFLSLNFGMLMPTVDKRPASRVCGTHSETASSASPSSAAEVYCPDRAVRDSAEHTTGDEERGNGNAIPHLLLLQGGTRTESADLRDRAWSYMGPDQLREGQIETTPTVLVCSRRLLRPSVVRHAAGDAARRGGRGVPLPQLRGRPALLRR